MSEVNSTFQNNGTQRRPENPKFYLSSFNRVITNQMNPTMAIQMYILIQAQETVSKELFAMSEKIRTQLFHMKMISVLDEALVAAGLPPIGGSQTNNEVEVDLGAA